jgi:hypothetical protein
MQIALMKYVSRQSHYRESFARVYEYINHETLKNLSELVLVLLLMTVRYPTSHTTHYLTLDLLILTPLYASECGVTQFNGCFIHEISSCGKKCGLDLSRFIIVQLLR